MNVASLELSKQLYELSGWEDTDLYYGENFYRVGDIELTMYRNQNEFDAREGQGKLRGIWSHADVEVGKYVGVVPAYDLGYLLRKLQTHAGIEISWDRKYGYTAHFNRREFGSTKDGALFNAKGENYEDATAKLAIELFKQGVLTKEGN